MLRRELSPQEKAELRADIARYEEITGHQKLLTAEAKAIRERIFSYLPEHPGEYRVAVPEVPVFTATVAEKLEWDEDVLKVLHDSEATKCVDVRYTIDARSYKKLSAEDKAVVAAALTRKPGQKKITVQEQE